MDGGGRRALSKLALRISLIRFLLKLDLFPVKMCNAEAFTVAEWRDGFLSYQTFSLYFCCVVSPPS